MPRIPSPLRSPAPPSPIRAERSKIEASYAVKNTVTGQWEKPQLGEAESHAMKNVVETIKMVGLRYGVEAFDEEGAALKLSKDGIYVRRDGNWVNVLHGKELSKGAKIALQKTLESISRLSSAVSAAESNIVIKVKVLTEAEQLGRTLKELKATGNYEAEIERGIRSADQTNQAYAKQVRRFAHAYHTRRELFEGAMRRQGISGLESAFLFNHLNERYDALQAWNQQLDQVTALLNQNRIPEALKAYSQLMTTEYPKLLQRLKPSLQAAEQMNPRVQKALKTFCNAARLNQNEFLEACFKPIHIDINNQFIRVAQIAQNSERTELIPDDLERASKVTDTELSHLDEAIDSFNSIAEQAHRFSNFFAMIKRLPEDHPLHSHSAHELNQAGWTEKKVNDMTALLSLYAALITPLKQAEQAIGQERDPQKKRALSAQFNQLKIHQAQKLNQLERQFQQLGGQKQLESLLTLSQNIVTEATHKFDILSSNRNYDEQTKQDLINILSESLTGTPEEQDTLMNTYGDFIPLVQVMAGGIPIEAEALVGITTSWRNDLHQTTQSINLISQWEFGSIANLMARPDFLDISMEVIEWQDAKLEAFGIWYDAYMKEALPLLNAYALLQADPENQIFQQSLQQMSNKHNARLNKLTQEFNRKYSHDEIQELESSLKEVGIELNIELTLLRTNQTLQKISELSHHAMSWDSDFLDPLTKSKEKAWLDALKDQEITSKHIQRIQKLFKNYQNELSYLSLLERELEAHPENVKLRNTLIKEMKLRKAALTQLESEYLLWSSKITALQEALKKPGLPPELSRLNITEAFRRKIEFQQNLYRRFQLWVP